MIKMENIFKLFIIGIIYILCTFNLGGMTIYGETFSNKKEWPIECKEFIRTKMTCLKNVWGNYEPTPLSPNNGTPQHLIASIVFSPDGSKVLSGQITPERGYLRGGIIKLWDVSTGQEICSFIGHTRPINSVSFSPDGLKAVSASDDGTIRLWSVSACKEIQILKKVIAKYSLAMAVAFSPTGKEILVGISEKPSLKLLDSNTGKEIRTYDIDWNIRKVSFSPDGKNALSISTYDEPSLWNVASGKIIRKLYRQSGIFSYLFSSAGSWICGNFSPDGKFILGGSSDGKIRLWETTSGKEIWSISAHDKSVNDVTFSPSGEMIVSTSNDASIKIINTANGNILDKISLTTSQDIGKSLAFSPNGEYFLVGTMRGVILQFLIEKNNGKQG